MDPTILLIDVSTFSVVFMYVVRFPIIILLKNVSESAWYTINNVIIEFENWYKLVNNDFCFSILIFSLKNFFLKQSNLWNKYLKRFKFIISFIYSSFVSKCETYQDSLSYCVLLNKTLYSFSLILIKYLKAKKGNMINPNKVQECHVYKIIIELITLIKEDNILATVVIIWNGLTPTSCSARWSKSYVSLFS